MKLTLHYHGTDHLSSRCLDLHRQGLSVRRVPEAMAFGRNRLSV